MPTKNLMTLAGSLCIDLDVLVDEPADVYHGKAGEHLTSHMLATFRACALLYARKRDGQVQVEKTQALTLGRAAHVRILEGKAAFADRYVIGGPVNPKTGKPFGAETQAFREFRQEAQSQGKEVLTVEQAELIEQMATGVGANLKTADLLMDGKAEGVVRLDYRGVPSQARFDWVHPRRGIVDLKTCDDLTWFEADARRYGYLHQMAFYRAVLAQAIDVRPVDVPVHLIAVEKKEPYRCGVW
ncbi:MAG: PD-(D/E)XK nuclease-like domain-containing protein, partial [Phycisphaeraceae bacterium]|nr:PD-(D/E)XK nuclease-like domain-containing protein [Phycisphaeraceae bacterium]